ncbi:MAG: DNA-directed RNA polymerase subunit beta' [Endomicrobium sp.]|jgi:DNA-directed RNA polymerase subunit beta'|nr:DNA-directed RNA polymerase subunit beta' [Endomicrobium sp.]
MARLNNTQHRKKKFNELNFKDFDAIKMTVASPDQIKNWSYGEVKKPETINYRTFKPERDGLFCDRIFGPIKNWECHCGKYKYIKHKGTICDRCGVEVTESKVRRERFGHIELAVPVAHLWFLKKSPSRIGILLNMKISDLDKVIYYTRYIVLKEIKDHLEYFPILNKGMLLRREEYNLFKLGINNSTVKEEFKNIIDGMITSKLVFNSNNKEDILKDIIKLLKNQVHISKRDDIAKKILEDIEQGCNYYKVYFQAHVMYSYENISTLQSNKLYKILLENFNVDDHNILITKYDKKIKIEFFDVKYNDLFNTMRQSATCLSEYEQYLNIVNIKNNIPFIKTFTNSENYCILDENLIKSFNEGFSNNLRVDIGAVGIRKLLESIDLKSEADNISSAVKKVKSDSERSKLIRKLRIIEGFLHSNSRPEWMILTVLPVLPPDLRPLVALDGGRFASSDLNDLYRRIINRNNRLRHIEQLKAPLVMINNEKRLLQEAVDALIDNDLRVTPVTGAGNRNLKSLSESLKGKQGRFRQNLLGKRVDYSGRSVIVVGPNLKLNQCGLPKEMALEIFKPFIIRELVKQENMTFRAARKMLEKNDVRVWNILANIVKEYNVLLNRAPTLHRLSIQAFNPVLVDGKSIQLHPLTCAAFNADFDGDQMAIHLPMSIEAQIEAKVLMMATRNILSPASGKPIMIPSQDMILGICYLTKEKNGVFGEGRIFSSIDEVIYAYQSNVIDLHAKIKVFGITNLCNSTLHNKSQLIFDVNLQNNSNTNTNLDYTTVGRIIFNENLPKNNDGSYVLGYKNINITKKELATIINRCYIELGEYATVMLLDNMKKIGYQYATLAGISISIDEMKIPLKKENMINKAKIEIKEIEKQARFGLITESERYNKIIDIWTKVTDEVADIMFDEMKKQETESYKIGEGRFNSVFMMADSGARGSRQQVRQLAGMRGLMAKPQKKLTGRVGEIIETPIIANFREGLSVLEYFISTHGGRKGLADTALKTAEAGYLTRRLVDVAHDIVIKEEDCGTLNGIFVGTLYNGDEIVEKIDDRVVGRIALDDVVDVIHDKIIIKKGELITKVKIDELIKAGIDKIGIRSILTCESTYGVCSKCYGSDLATGKQVEQGEAVGIIAAQSIGEPGTQLTLRTFHIGGAASRVVQRSEIYAENDGEVEYHNLKVIQNNKGDTIVLSRNTELTYTEFSGYRKLIYQIPYGSTIKVKNKQKIQINIDSKSGMKKNVLIAKWDPHSKPIISEFNGFIYFIDIQEGVTLQKDKSRITGQIERVIIERSFDKKNPRIVIKGYDNNILIEYPLPIGTNLVAYDGDRVNVGDILAKIPQEFSKSKDITGGLPRVAELFEARKPKDVAIISDIDGIIHLCGNTSRGNIKIEVRNHETNIKKSYIIPTGRHIIVYEGDKVNEGDALSDGAINPHDILKVKGPKEVQEYLVNEIQQIYRLQGVTINDKHIEIIVKQMLSNVKIVDSGDSKYLNGEIISKYKYEEECSHIKSNYGKLPSAQPILLGITKASLSSSSFISAASFQETTRILTEAAVFGQIDNLRGLKENVSIGHLIPAGTGFRKEKI